MGRRRLGWRSLAAFQHREKLVGPDQEIDVCPVGMTGLAEVVGAPREVSEGLGPCVETMLPENLGEALPARFSQLQRDREPKGAGCVVIGLKSGLHVPGGFPVRWNPERRVEASPLEPSALPVGVSSPSGFGVMIA